MLNDLEARRAVEHRDESLNDIEKLALKAKVLLAEKKVAEAGTLIEEIVARARYRNGEAPEWGAGAQRVMGQER